MFFEPFSNKRPEGYSLRSVYFVQTYISIAIRMHAKELIDNPASRMQLLQSHVYELAVANGTVKPYLSDLADKILIECYIEQEADTIGLFIEQNGSKFMEKITAPEMSTFFLDNMKNPEFSDILPEGYE